MLWLSSWEESVELAPESAETVGEGFGLVSDWEMGTNFPPMKIAAETMAATETNPMLTIRKCRR